MVTQGERIAWIEVHSRKSPRCGGAVQLEEVPPRTTRSPSRKLHGRLSEYGEQAGPSNARANQFRCPGCHADMRFDAASGSMTCDYCGEAVAFEEQEKSQEIVEYDLMKGLADGEQSGFGDEVRRSTCQACGASVCFGSNVTATLCDFCGSNQVLQEQELRRLIRPESLVPFRIEKERAHTEFKNWISKLWFRPNDLKHRAKVAEIGGVYVPYWTFDSVVASDWTAQAGYYYYETESYTTTENGQTVTRTRQVRRTRWVPAWGSRTDAFDDVLICASGGLPSELAHDLETFDTTALVPYSSEYLAGFKAEEYSVELNDGWESAVDRMANVQKRRCSNDVPGDTQRFLSVRNAYSSQTFKHVLLPIWIASYRYGDDIHRFLVNGQTGEVTGTAPWSWIKITLVSILVLGVVCGGIYLFTQSR